MNLERALAIATAAHAGQTQRNGEPFILHPLRVMLALSQGPAAPAGNELDALRIVAVLHDVVEDTEWTFDQLRAEGLSDVRVAALDSVTKREGEAYPDFVRRSAADPIGRRVKLADLEDNLDARRLPTWKDKDGKRARKYLAAWRFLKGLSDTPDPEAAE